ncbi:MFS transporter [Aldersonia kunmingensis]|uniref:MFS transporter n=1 Tax=Aldersonia kunmingensis TaxID=408066 RepID=UPI00082C2DB1|nr:MFS transporter [Aldersonia kunmingensis]
MSDPAATLAVSRRRWVSLAATCTAAGLVWLAFADLAVAIPNIADEFHSSLSALQWANNAFALVAGSLVIACGKFADVYGRRRMLQLGLALFTGFSVVAALAPDVGTLVIGRALMGVGAALILPASLAIIPPQFSGRAQLTAFGVWQAVAWGGQAVAPAIGGVITDVLDWRWLFWINLPLGIAAFAVVRVFTPESKDEEASSRVDWVGLVTIGLAVFALLYALTDGPDVGWASPLVIGLLVATVVLAIAWVLVEQRVREPLVDLSLFRLRPYDGALTANLMMNLSYAGLSYLLVLWLQNVRDYSPIEAGLMLLPATVGIFAFIPLGGRLDASRGGRFPVVIGLAVLGIGLAVFGALESDTTLWLIGGALVVVGVGLGLLSTPISNTAVGDVPQDLAGTAAGVFKMSSMVGGALGVALLSAFARGFAESDASSAFEKAGLDQADLDQAESALVNSASFSDAIKSLPSDIQGAVTSASIDAFSTGLSRAMAVAALLVLLAAVAVSAIWPRRANRVREPD